MAIPNFDTWRSELLATGRIAQDGDAPEVWDNSESDVKRYLELVEMACGVHEERVLGALLDSMQVEDDYEVYESTVRVMFSFPPEVLGVFLARSFRAFMVRAPERAGDFLSLMVNYAEDGDATIHYFKATVLALDEVERQAIAEFVRSQEARGWLDNKPGRYEEVLMHQPGC